MEVFTIKKFKLLLILIFISIILYCILNILGVYFINQDNNNNKYTKDIITNSDSVDNIVKKEDKTVFSYSEIPDNIKEKMLGLSMPYDEPLSFNELRYLKLSYYGFDNETHTGEMIVNKEVASEVVDIFKELYDKKYPIEKIALIDEYQANDELSMKANNSSSFCYRTIANTNTISNHGLGLAIDINPFQNPHVIKNNTNPKEAFSYSDRNDIRLGMIREGDDCYNAFIKRGWIWGGHWNNPDYQHFEKIN